MEKQIKDIIQDFKNERKIMEEYYKEATEAKNIPLGSIMAGKVSAYSDCINRLEEIFKTEKA